MLGILQDDFLFVIATQFRQSPHQGIQAVGRLGELRNVVAHLVFEHAEGAHMVYTVLLVERGDGFRTYQLAAGGMHGLVGEIVIDVAENGFDQIAAVIGLRSDCPGIWLAPG